MSLVIYNWLSHVTLLESGTLVRFQGINPIPANVGIPTDVFWSPNTSIHPSIWWPIAATSVALSVLLPPPQTHYIRPNRPIILLFLSTFMVKSCPVRSARKGGRMSTANFVIL